jgi:hypothetical protein
MLDQAHEHTAGLLTRDPALFWHEQFMSARVMFLFITCFHATTAAAAAALLLLAFRVGACPR